MSQSQGNNDATSEILLSSDLDNHLNNLIQCISDDDHDHGETLPECVTLSQYLANNELPENYRIVNQLSPSNSCGARLSSQLNEDKYLQCLQNTHESTEVKQSKNIDGKSDDNVVITELFLEHGSKKINLCNTLSKMSRDFSKYVANKNDKSIYKVETRITETEKTFKRKNSNCSDNVGSGQNCHLSSSWPGDTNKLAKKKYQTDYNLTNLVNEYNSESVFMKDEDKTYRTLTEELHSGEIEPSHYKNVYRHEILTESFETGINSKSLTSTPHVSHDTTQHYKSVLEVQVISQSASDEPMLVEDKTRNMLLHTTDEYSFHTLRESSSCDNFNQHKEDSSHMDKNFHVYLPEKPPTNSLSENLLEAPSKDFNCEAVTNLPHINLCELTQTDIILPISAETTHSLCDLSDRSETAIPTINRTMKISHGFTSTVAKKSHSELHAGSPATVYEISRKNISPENASSINSSSVLEPCQHKSEKHISNNSECKYQQLPRSPLMPMNLDGIPYSLLSDDHIVPQYDEVQKVELERNTTTDDSDHNYCEETKQDLLSEVETLHSLETNCGSVQNCEAKLTCPKIICNCTKLHQVSTKVNVSISSNLNDGKNTHTISSAEESENSPTQHCLDKYVISHLSNEASILSFEDTINSEEHKVPDAESCEYVPLSEISLYSDLHKERKDDLKCNKKTKQVFQWKMVYDTQMNKSLTDQNAGDSVFEGLSSIQPICQSQRPRRVGLSRKQNVKHLHNKS